MMREPMRRLRLWWRGVKARRLTGEFLCDSCSYNYRSACNRPERPNAIRCPDYDARY